MAGEYVLPADLSPDTFAEYAAGLTLTASEASSARLTAAIAAASQRLDDLTQDHFSTQTAATVELDVALMSPSLPVPRRIKTITTVKTRAYDGTLTTQDATAYRITKSLDSTGAIRVSKDAQDSLDLIPDGPGLAVVPFGNWYWPVGVQAVQLVGDFGWTVTPRPAKRFVALLVFDHFKERRADLGRVEVVQNANETIRYTLIDPAAGVYTGIGEADAIVADLKRSDPVMVW